jgi:hypothetical protein
MQHWYSPARLVLRQAESKQAPMLWQFAHPGELTSRIRTAVALLCLTMSHQPAWPWSCRPCTKLIEAFDVNSTHISARLTSYGTWCGATWYMATCRQHWRHGTVSQTVHRDAPWLGAAPGAARRLMAAPPRQSRGSA